MAVLQYVAILSSLVEDYHNAVCSALQCGVMSHPVQCNVHCGRVVGGLLEKLELHVAHMHWWSDVQCSPTPLQCYAVHMNTCTGQMCPMLYNIFLLYNTLCTGGQMCSMFFTPLQYMYCSLHGHCTAFGQKSIALH